MGNVFSDFLIEKGLYDKIRVTPENVTDLILLLSGNAKIDLYCPACKEKRVFNVNPVKYENSVHQLVMLSESLVAVQRNINNARISPGSMNGNNYKQVYWNWMTDKTKNAVQYFQITCKCAMMPLHEACFTLKIDGEYIIKIGQYPSVADLTFPELDVYNHILQKEDRREMGTAIGLFANGVGAGAYVYLRRIFERLLYQAADLAEGLDKESFISAKVDEKIKMVKDTLPPMLTENTKLYRILSKGIHELSEQECLEYFPVLKDCIFMILEQWEEQRRKKARQDSLTNAISKIASKM